METSTSWGERLRALRKERGITSRFVADRMGVTPQAVRKVEISAAPTGPTIERYLAALGLELAFVPKAAS